MDLQFNDFADVSICCNDWHLINAFNLIDVFGFKIVTFSSEEHPRNANLSIVSTDRGIVTFVSNMHNLNEFFPI